MDVLVALPLNCHVVCAAHHLASCQNCDVNFTTLNFQQDNMERVPVLSPGSNRFTVEIDRQIQGTSGASNSLQPISASGLFCSDCGLCWLVGHAGKVVAAQHPSHCTLENELTGTCRSLVVFTDGACSHNGEPYAEAGIGVFFAPESKYNISSPLSNSPTPTNQKAELHAILRAMQVVREDIIPARAAVVSHDRDQKQFRLLIVTDSDYAVKGLCEYWKSWNISECNGQRVLLRKAGTTVVNSELFLAIHNEVEQLAACGIQVVYSYIPRERNRDADALARAAVPRRQNSIVVEMNTVFVEFNH